MPDIILKHKGWYKRTEVSNAVLSIGAFRYIPEPDPDFFTYSHLDNIPTNSRMRYYSFYKTEREMEWNGETLVVFETFE